MTAPVPRAVEDVGVRYNPALTEDEVTVLQWLANGKKHPDIAELMGRTRVWVAMRASKAMTKIGACTSCGAVAFALRRGLIK